VLTPGILSPILRAHAYRVVIVVRPVLFYGYNSKLAIPSHYGLLSSYIPAQLLSIYPTSSVTSICYFYLVVCFICHLLLNSQTFHDSLVKVIEHGN